jgi:hypothetical protein
MSPARKHRALRPYVKNGDSSERFVSSRMLDPALGARVEVLARAQGDPDYPL